MKRYLRDESAAVAVIVAVFIASIAIILAAIVIDLGGLWSSQRALVTDTDAAALAGAIELAEGWMENGGECGNRSDAEDEAERVLLLNNPQNRDISTDADCEEPVTAADFSGWVQITAQQPSPGFISGRDDLSAGGTTTAEFMLGVSDFEEDGLAVCADLFPGGSLSLASEFQLSEDRLAVPYHKAVQTLVDQLSTACGVESQWLPPGGPAPITPGGWGWLKGTCTPDLEGSGDWCDVRVGNRIKALNDLVGEEIRYPIFDAWDGDPGNGAGLRIVGVLKATLDNTCDAKGAGGPPADPGGGPPADPGQTPADPQLCELESNLGTDFNGQPEFIVVSNPRAFFFDQPQAGMFDTVTYSICDVQGDRTFCRSRG